MSRSNYDKPFFVASKHGFRRRKRMDAKVSKELCEKARELGKMVAITDKTGLPPMELLGLYSMCQAIDNFLTVFEKGEPKYGEGGAK